MTDKSKTVPAGSYQVSFVDSDVIQQDGRFIKTMFFVIEKGEQKGKTIELNFDLTGDEREKFYAYMCAIFQSVGQEIIQSEMQLLNKNFFLTVKEENGNNLFSSAESVSKHYLRKAKI